MRMKRHKSTNRGGGGGRHNLFAARERVRIARTENGSIEFRTLARSNVPPRSGRRD